MSDTHQPAFSFIERILLHSFAVLVSHDGYSHSGLFPVYVDLLSYSPGYIFPLCTISRLPDANTLPSIPTSAITFYVLLLLDRVGEMQ